MNNSLSRSASDALRPTAGIVVSRGFGALSLGFRGERGIATFPDAACRVSTSGFFSWPEIAGQVLGMNMIGKHVVCRTLRGSDFLGTLPRPAGLG